MRIEEEYKLTGYFWLPGEQDQKIPGVLTINDGGKIELEVVGRFDGSLKLLNGDRTLWRILGDVEKEGLVTLENCFYKNMVVSSSSIFKSKVHVGMVFGGAAWEEDREVKFNTFSFSVDCLDEWVGISGIDVDSDWNNGTASVRYSPPEAISFKLDNDIELEIVFAYSLPSYPVLNEVKITQSAFFTLKSKKLLCLSDLTFIAFKICNLMCFAMDETVAMKNLSATTSEITMSFTNGETHPANISIYYQSLPYTAKTPKKQQYEMLFTFPSIKNNAQHIFNSWINSYDYLSPALSLYFSAKEGAQQYLDGRFLALVQGLETYHRRTSTETLMNPMKYETLRESIIKGCPENKKEWLRGRLMHGNEISLRKRIAKIVEPFEGHLGTKKDRGKLISKIVDTRNYLTHYDESGKRRSAEGLDLYDLCQKMEAILSLHFLKVIGFTEEEINAVIQQCDPMKRKIANN